MTDLEARFEQEMVEKVYRTTGRETGYWAGYFLRAVKRHGGVGAARRLDLAMETLVLDPTYGLLFTDAEREVAARRLHAARLTETPDRHSLPP